jgi:hypothetical protein
MFVYNLRRQVGGNCGGGYLKKEVEKHRKRRIDTEVPK